eukprot:7652147-Alexandrium_andersonii.AAC.1
MPWGQLPSPAPARIEEQQPPLRGAGGWGMGDRAAHGSFEIVGNQGKSLGTAQSGLWSQALGAWYQLT